MNSDYVPSPIRALTASLGLLACLIPLNCHAINASPFAVQAQQADGTAITLKVRGDERYHWQEDSAGYTVIRHNNNFFYAQRNPAGHLVPTPHPVGKANPKALGLQKHLLPSSEVLSQMRAAAPNGSNDGSASAEQVPAAGAIKNLVVMIRFSDHVNRSLPTTANMNVLFNADSPHATLAPTGSVKAVYLENSYGQMTLNSTINDWVTVSETEAYYANGNSGDSTLWQALKEALDAVDGAINFSEYDQDGDGYIDSITFIHSGYGAEWGNNDAYGTYYTNRIWSHRWGIGGSWTSNEGVKVYDYHISPGVWGTSGSAIGRIGVISHETGHFFGLPDLYDTDSGGSGIGSFGMMANSWGFDGSQKYPPHFSPWSKIALGWLSPTSISQAGNYSLDAVESSPQVYRIDQGYPGGEYLLLENRQAQGFDAAMPQGGLAIWHIDDSTGFNTEGYPGQANWPANGNHYRVALLQADGKFDLERDNNNRGDSGDVWHASGVEEINATTSPGTDAYQGGIISATDNRIYNISASADSMSFDYEYTSTPVLPPIAPTLNLAKDVGNGSVDLAWLDSSDNEDGFKILRNNIEVAGLSANTSTYTDTGVPEGSHNYKVQAHNDGGQNTADSNELTVTVILPVISHAYAETTTFGGRIGDYVDTQALAGEEVLTEVESGGKPSKRTSRMEHIWRFGNVQNSAATLITVDAYTGVSNSGADNFDFSYSNDGSNYLPLFTFANGDDNVRSAQLSNSTGEVWLKVVDSNRDRGERSLDGIHIRQLFIEWGDELSPSAPSNLLAQALSSTAVSLSWEDGIGETSYEVQRWDGATWQPEATAPADSTSTQVNDLEPGTGYTFRVCGEHLSESEGCSNTVSISTFGAGTPVLNSASGYKVKGVQRVDLGWSFTGRVSVFQDGNNIADIDASPYTHDIGSKGGGSYDYLVCEYDSNNCSNSLTVVF